MDAAGQFLDAEIERSVLSREDRKRRCSGSSTLLSLSQGMEIGGVGNDHNARIRSQGSGARLHRDHRHQVTHDLIGEGDVVEKLQTQMQTGENIYDAYVNDSDLIGTHWRYQQVRNLTDWMAGEGADVTKPNAQPRRFHRHSVHHRSGRQALPAADQQFANLYWFRYDWFTDEKNMADFEGRIRLSARRAGQLVGLRGHRRVLHRPRSVASGRRGPVYGNMDYGKKDPSLGWRYTDAWMSMAGMGDVGEPNGLPVDEWGIRVNETHSPSAPACPWRRHQLSGGGLRRREGHRLAEELLRRQKLLA
jgi:glycerol transport system substrate-binding protein